MLSHLYAEYRLLPVRDGDDEAEDPEDYFGPAARRETRPERAGVSLLAVCVVLGACSALALLLTFPFPTTIHVFIGALISLGSYVFFKWVSWAYNIFVVLNTLSRRRCVGLKVSRPTGETTASVACSLIVVIILCIGLLPRAETAPPINGERVFIAANLHDSEGILPRWSSELLKLVQYLGPEKTFVSIYESNSEDSTPDLLSKLSSQLDLLGAGHRILSAKEPRSWPYATSPERIGFLAKARNKALEPLQSPEAKIRIPDYDSYDKILFLNDIVYSWQAAVRLLATPGEYDLVCGMDYYFGGLYDTWAARDVCGTPLRPTWPHVKDGVSKGLLRNGHPFEVSSCWNGIVAFPSAPYLYRPVSKRGWKAVDNYASSRLSPPISLPLQFRASGIEACDHSECFLFSYDLHRLHDDRAPKILMNPTVIVAYSSKWYAWNRFVLHMPIVEWWTYYWSHGVPLLLVDWIWELASRRRDYCTWAALGRFVPDRCPPLPGVVERTWNQ